MSTDMRLLILTHLRAAMERKDKAAVRRAMQTAHRHGDTVLADRMYEALRKDQWAAVEGVYLHLGGVGAGEPIRGAGEQKNGVSVAVGAVVVPADVLIRARADATGAPAGWMTLENRR